MEGLLSELDYFEPQVLQMSINAEYDRVFGIGQTLVHGGPIEFFIRGADGLYLDLNNSKLEIKAKITNENGTNIAAANVVGPLNDILNSMFMSVEMELGGVLITDPNTKYAFRAILENIINYSQIVTKTRLLAEGWIKDTAAHQQDTDPAGANEGLHDRAQGFNNSHTVCLIGRPHLDLFHQEKLIPANINLRLRFTPNTSPFTLKTAVPADAEHPQQQYKLQILSARLFIRTKEIAPSLINAQEKILQNHNYSIPFNRITTKTLAIPNGTTSIEFDNVYQGKLPELIIMVMVSDANMAGGYNINPFNFQHFGVNYICMQANGDQIPRIALQADFANADYIRAYFGVIEALGYDVGPNCWDLTPAEWANGYTIWAFKLSPGPIGTVKSPSRVGSARLEIKFAAATAQNITYILLSQQPAEVQIDKYKNVQLIT